MKKRILSLLAVGFTTYFFSLISLYSSEQKKRSVVRLSFLETPRKILIPESTVPNNAIFTLLFDNPTAEIITRAKIYDLNGAEVNDFFDAAGSGSNPVRLTWNGRDRSGSLVHSGIYSYEVQAGNSIFNGTVVVVR